MTKNLKKLWQNRGFIYGSVIREFKKKYKNSLLGTCWSILNPLAMILVYTLIFSHVMKSKVESANSTYGYAIYICTGVITWNLFSEIILRLQNLFIDNANLIKKVNFPHLNLLIIAICGSTISFLISFALFAVTIIFLGLWPGWISITLIPIVIIQITFAISLGMILGILNVFYRDVGQFMLIFIQIWFWITPIIYPLSIIPEYISGYMIINPMYSLIESYHNVFLSGIEPNWINTIYPIACSLLLLVLGKYIYINLIDEMIDEL
jgi:lipopolysaccharide transport system permease protein